MINIIIDKRGLYAEISRYAERMLDDFEVDFLGCIDTEIEKVLDTRELFIARIEREFKELKKIFKNHVFEYTVGLDSEETPDSYIFVTAMVIAYGTGTLGRYNKPLMAGPLGAPKWNKDLSQKVPSKIDPEIEVDSTWEHYGYSHYHNGLNYLENTMIIMKPRWELMIENFKNQLPADILTRHMRIVDA